MEFEKRGLKVNIPARTTTLNGERMTEKQLFDYTIRRGELIRKNAERILKFIDSIKDEEMKKKAFEKAIDKIETKAKEEIAKKYQIKPKSQKRKEIPTIKLKK